ncbi:hypothetical protein HN51_064132 [Arachis hypogaea]|uniref:Uncharacterized protein n=1 Tax=Arachis hypogaea TaxID=3818 RepID=A0A445AVM2_ARAHY|nr:uncharacterized protein LOC107640945 [Arachis ipaensis]XP_025630543.1 uncharacterized protein LOC112723393 [Arachis hypogaea]QHO21735.1 G-type lectin S-receptor-like serine/threonine-protein kinase [Arachis hypogaea]RYR30457.1 hypothetical protein Ahy_B01g055226 [Arachis hypogaea]
MLRCSCTTKTPIFLFLFLIFHFQILFYQAHCWIKAGYWFYGSEFPVSNIETSLYTHLLCAFADVNASTYELSIPSDAAASFPSFTATLKHTNPSLSTLLSIGGGTADYTVLSSMVSNASSRKSFIHSSITLARTYGFQGLDLSWVSANTTNDLKNMGLLFQEWREAAKSEAINSTNNNNQELILTAAVPYQPGSDFGSYPVESISDNLNWVNVLDYDYYTPQSTNFTGAHSALYDPSSDVNTDTGIKRWIDSGVSASKLVLSLPFYGYAWKLRNQRENGIGAAATGPAITKGGDMTYKEIKDYVQRYEATVLYNATYVVNYFSIGSNWIGFDDADAVKTKVSYAKEKKLGGYVVWQVPYDDDKWQLSSAAAQQVVGGGEHHNWRLPVVITLTSVVCIILLGFIIYYIRRRLVKPKGIIIAARDAGHFPDCVPDVQVFSLCDIELATDRFSIENKLGQGGYGPVYKGILPDGREIAVKKLSKTSTQGFEEFKNEVTLTARLQHVNLVQLLGFYIDREEQMLVYEYMPNKSLDYYLFDPIRRLLLDWSKRVAIIEGVTQGLLYLQEYSRLTIIHRDIKASNILLDGEMKPKISDFGMARIFSKDEQEANTAKIVGTYGYVSPEYLKKGLYSVKSDVYSFGVLLLQIIGGKVTRYYGEHENLTLMEYAYELWKEGRGMEFADPFLDDTASGCKILRCIQIGLLCVQEDANDRPSVLEISSMLRSETVLATPKKPAFSREKDMQEHGEFVMKQEHYSVNEATMSQIVAR